MPDFEIENSLDGEICGIDEAGRGPWAGPVVAGAVILDRKNISQELIKNLNDSKKISKKKRELLYSLLMIESEKGNAKIGVGISEAVEIDEINILQATFKAMKRSYSDMTGIANHTLIDGNKVPTEFPTEATAVIKGDGKSLSIAAASIIAKVTRDKMMDKLAADFPMYLWEKNAGYGTKAHVEALKKHGITDHHRKSYKPIRELIDSNFK